MTKDELINLGLNEEQATSVLNAYKMYIPKARFDEVNEAKKNAEALLEERDKQLDELQKSNQSNGDLQTQIKQLQEENAAAKAKYESDIKAIQIDNAVELALLNASARNTKAVKALLDLTNAELTDGNVKGLKEQIDKLKNDENSKFLFKEQTASAPVGMKPSEGIIGTPKPTKPKTYLDWVAELENK